MLLGDLGATSRSSRQPRHEPGHGRRFRRIEKDATTAGTASVNRNKRSIVLDLKSDTGRDAFFELAKDAVVENANRAGVATSGCAK